MKLSIEKDPEALSSLANINYVGHYPTGGSFKQIEHFRQIMLTGEFKMFDYEFSTGSEADKKKKRSTNLN